MKADRPRTDDDLETAEAKSRTVDERIPPVHPMPAADDTIVAGAPAAFIPQTGAGAATTLADDLGPGEIVLEQEAKAQKSKIQRG